MASCAKLDSGEIYQYRKSASIIETDSDFSQIKQIHSSLNIDEPQCGQSIDILAKIHQHTEDDCLIYHMAIIDFLQDYGVRKVLERFGKSLTVKNADTLSVAPPSAYGTRFKEFCMKNLFK